jgi:hypothetical protein
MLTPTLLTIALTLSTQTDAKKPTVLVLDLEAAGASKDDAHFVTVEVAKTFSTPGTVDVLTATDLRRLAALESEKQAAGCEAQSCLAEIANAMGAQYVVFGSVGRIDASYVAELTLFEAAAAKPISRRDIKGDSLSALIARVPRETHALAGTLLPPYAGPDPDAEVDSGPNVLLIVGAVAGGVGAAAALGGAGGAGFAASRVMDQKAAAADRNGMKTVGAASTIVLGAGGALAALGGAVAVFAWSAE